MAMSKAEFHADDVLNQLDLQEKIRLLTGINFWHTASIPRLGIPSLRISDGPNGVRGTKWFKAVPTACLPSGESKLRS